MVPIRNEDFLGISIGRTFKRELVLISACRSADGSTPKQISNASVSQNPLLPPLQIEVSFMSVLDPSCIQYTIESDHGEGHERWERKSLKALDLKPVHVTCSERLHYSSSCKSKE